MVAQKVEAAVVDYLAKSLSKDDYYTQDAEQPGVWMGEAATLLGLDGEVTREPFARLARNQHPFEEHQLTPRRRERRRVGYDITFTAPKSVSILFIVTQDSRILEAFQRNVSTTMSAIEAEVRTRVRRDGADFDRVTGNLVWGEFLHLTARPVDGTPDPLIHVHAFTFNCTYDGEERRWKAGQFGTIKQRMPLYEAEFHSSLAMDLESLGYSTAPTKHAFEVLGVKHDEIQEFSRRTKAIDSIAAERGYDAEDKAKLRAKTRKFKCDDYTFSQLRGQWLDRLGPEATERIRRLHENGAQPPRVEHAGAEAAPEFEQHSQDVGVTSTNGPARKSDTWLEREYPEPGPMEYTAWGPHLLKPLSANAAAKEAVRLLLERDAVVTEDRLYERAMRLGVGRATPTDIADALLARPELVRREVNGRTYVTTREALREEKQLVDFARLGRGRTRSIGVFPVSLSQFKLDGRDREVLSELLSSKDVVTLFKHTGPSEKPALSRAAMTGIQEAGYALWVVSPNSASARQAEKDYGIKHVHTVRTLLGSGDVRDELKTKVRRRVIWVDDAGRLGTKTVAALARLAAKTGARIVLSGDTARMRSFERGNVFRLLREKAGLTTAERRVVRDKQGVRQEALEALLQAPAIAVERMHDLGALTTSKPEDVIKNAVEYYAEQLANRRTPLLVGVSGRTAALLNTAVREWLRANGVLRSKDRSVLQFDTLHWSDRQKRDASLYNRGMVVHFHRPSTGFKAGDRARVIGTDPLGLVWVTQGLKRPVFPLNPLHVDRFTVSEPHRTHLAVGDRIRLTRYCKPKLGKPLRSNRVLKVTGFDPVGDIVVNGLTIIPRRFGHFEHDYATTAATVHGRRADAVGVVLGEEHAWRTNPADLVNAASAGKKDFRVFADHEGTVVNSLEHNQPTTMASDLAESPEELDLQQQAYEEQVVRMQEDRERKFHFER